MANAPDRVGRPTDQDDIDPVVGTVIIDPAQTLDTTDQHTSKQPVHNAPEALPDHLTKDLEKLALKHEDGTPQYVKAHFHEPLFYSTPPYRVELPKASEEMIHRYITIDHETHLRLFRMSYDEDLHAPVSGSFEVYQYEQLPECIFLANSAAFSREHVASISIDDHRVAVPRGFEYLLRWLRSSLGQKIEDILIFALVVCLHSGEPKHAMERLPTARISCYDTIDTVNSWSEETLHSLAVHKVDEVLPVAQLAHARQLDGGFWADHYSISHMPLDRTANEIRLLSLHLHDNEPHLYLWHTVLGDENLYTALSYAWGEGTSTIAIQENELTISRNLHEFLTTTIEMAKGIAKTHGTMYTKAMIYWIDAICINQEDEREKNWQIKRMHEIYSRAMHVVAWLGHGNLSLLSAMQHKIDSMEIKPDEELFAREYRLQMPLWNGDAGLSIMDTFSRPYFTRAWTTQELVSAKTISVQCGQHLVSMDYLALLSPVQLDMAMFGCLLEQQNADIDDTIAFMRGITVSRPGLVNRYKARRAARKPVTILSLLLATLNMKSKIAKDKIYSLWSIADDASELLGDIDYKQTDAELFTELAASWMSRYRRLDILAVRSTPDLAVLTSNCPTWAVDWHDYDRAARPFLSAYPSGVRGDALDEPERNRLYDASKGIDFYLARRFAHSDSRSTVLSPALMVAGISCDSIAQLTDAHLDLELGAGWLNFSNSTDLYAAFAAGRSPDGAKVEPHDPRRYFKLPEGFDPLELHKSMATSETVDAPGKYGLAQNPILEQYFEGVAWRQHVQANTFGRRIAVTHGGHIGLVPAAAKVGDEIAVVFNCSIPLVFRRTPLFQKQLIGDAYFHRMMDGEMIEAAGGGVQCLTDLLNSVQEEVSRRKCRGAAATCSTAVEADRDNTFGSRDTAASVSTSEQDSTTSHNDPVDRTAASGRQNLRFERGEDVWVEELNAPMLDVLNAARRCRRMTDSGVWTQLFHLPGSPDCPEFMEHRRQYREKKQAAKDERARMLSEEYEQRQRESASTPDEMKGRAYQEQDA